MRFFGPLSFSILKKENDLYPTKSCLWNSSSRAQGFYLFCTENGWYPRRKTAMQVFTSYTLYRENELLKHQLKKYVGAVQKLRDGPQAYETLAQLEGAKVEEGSNKYIDYHYEASEYEKKLIQVSDH